MKDEIPPPIAPSEGLSDNAASGLAYVTIIPAIIFLIVAPYNQKPIVRFHAWQSIFLNIGAFAIHLALMFIPIIGWAISIVFSLLVFVVWLICMVKAFSGQRFNIPVISNLAAQQARS